MQFSNLLVVFFALFITASCSSAPSFCKCTCFTNSTIIELTPKTTTQKSTNLLDRSLPDSSSSLQRRSASSTACSQCNRAFCIAQNLPICKNAEEKDIFTTCFQRDSRKDQIIVVGFICTTVGLLGWAAGKKVIEKGKLRAPNLLRRRGSQRDTQGVYEPVNNE